MKIGELARHTGLAASAIRFYEEQGLLPHPKRGANGYREYDAAAIEQLRILVAVQDLGFSLDDIGRLFMQDGSCSKTRTIEQIDTRLLILQQQELALAAQRKALEDLRLTLAESVRTGQPPACKAFVARSARARQTPAPTFRPGVPA